MRYSGKHTVWQRHIYRIEAPRVVTKFYIMSCPPMSTSLQHHLSIQQWELARYRCRIEHLIQGEASQRASAARPLPRVRHLTVPTMVGKTIPLPICSILKMSEAPEGARFNSFLATLNIDKESLGRPDSGADIRNGGENRDGTCTAVILHRGDPMLRVPTITLTPSSKISQPTMDACTWITLGCRTWVCADVQLTVRARPQRKHFKSKNCVQCNYAMKQNRAWGKKMGLIVVEAGKEGEEPMMSDAADDKEDRVG